MSSTSEIDVVFFDIGGTLGTLDPATGRFEVFPGTAQMLRALRDDVGLRLGVITTLGDQLTKSDVLDLLRRAGLDLDALLDPAGFVSERDAGAAKPAAAIYRFAAGQVGAAVGRCAFVGENLAEVIGARAAGMTALLKPPPPPSSA